MPQISITLDGNRLYQYELLKDIAGPAGYPGRAATMLLDERLKLYSFGWEMGDSDVFKVFCAFLVLDPESRDEVVHLIDRKATEMRSQLQQGNHGRRQVPPPGTNDQFTHGSTSKRRKLS